MREIGGDVKIVFLHLTTFVRISESALYEQKTTCKLLETSAEYVWRDASGHESGGIYAELNTE